MFIMILAACHPNNVLFCEQTQSVADISVTSVINKQSWLSMIRIQDVSGPESFQLPSWDWTCRA